MSVPLRVKLLLLMVVWLALNSAHGQPVTPIGAVGEGYVDAMAFTYDGKFLYSTDYLILEYDPFTGRCEKIHQIHGSRTFAIAGFPHDSRVAIATADGWLYVWDRQSDAVLASARFFTGGPMTDGFSQSIPKITVSGSGDLIALVYGSGFTSVDNELTLYDTGTLTEISPPPGGGTYSSAVPAVFSPDGFELYAASREGDTLPADLNLRIVRWNLLRDTAEIVEDGFESLYLNAFTCESDGLRYGLGSHDDAYCNQWPGCGFMFAETDIGIYWSSWLKLPNDSRASVTTGVYREYYCGYVYCWDTFYGFAGAPSVISPGGKYLIRDHRFTDLISGTVISEKAPYRALFNSDATMVAGIGYEDERYYYPIQLMTPKWGRVLSRIPTDLGSFYDAFTINEAARSFTAIQDQYAIRYDLDSGSILGAKQVPTSYHSTNGAITSPRGDFSVVYTDVGAIVGDGDGLTTQTLLLPNQWVGSACVNPSSNRLLLVAKELREYEVDTEDFARTPLVRQYKKDVDDEIVYVGAMYTPDGRYLLAASGPIHKFDTVDGALVSEYALDYPCYGVSIDPSGTFMVGSIYDGTASYLQIYRLDTMERVGDFSVPDQAFDFLGDGLVILTADGRLWQTDNGEYLGNIRPTSKRRIDRVVGSRTSDMVWLGDYESILGWRIPASRLRYHPTQIAIDEVLLRHHVAMAPDRNGDGVVDSADVLLANRSRPHSGSMTPTGGASPTTPRSSWYIDAHPIEEKLLPPESRPLTLSHAAQLDPPDFLREE